MAVNKVVLGDRTLIDLSYDTATEADVAKGKYFHRADGEIVEGTLEGSGGSGGGGELVEREVNFYDYDGTLLYSYDLAGVQAMNELPEPPTHEGLTFQRWNWTLDEIKSQNGEANVGASYITDDRKTRLYINIAYDVQKTVTILVGCQVATTMVINWGDGTDDRQVDIPNNSIKETVAYFSHTYENTGEYVITLSHDADYDVYLGSRSRSVFNQTRGAATEILRNGILRKIEIGRKMGFGPCALCNCSNLKTMTMPTGCSYQNLNGDTTYISYCNIALKALVIPRSFYFCSNHYYGCSNLEVLSLPGNLAGVSDNAFTNCKSLNNITIPNSAQSLLANCFSNNSFRKITVPKNITSVKSNAFSNNTRLMEITIQGNPTTWEAFGFNSPALESFDVPKSVKTIPGSAFSSCSNLKNVNLPEKLTSIGYAAFKTCYKLSSIHIPDSVSSIGSSAFYNCSSLCEVNIPESLTELSTEVFGNCAGIVSLEMPAGINTIGSNAFYNCVNLRRIDFSRHTTVPTLAATSAFGNNHSTFEIRVPLALYDEWIAATNWSSYKNKIVAV